MLTFGSSPAIEWRNFAYEPKGKSVDRYRLGSVISAKGAVEASIELESGEEISLDDATYFNETFKVGKLFEEKKFEEALATIGLALAKVLRMKAPNHILAIILPGGSRVFYPQTDIEGTLDVVCIKMYQRMSDERAPYSFQAVKRGRSKYERRRDPQTKAFLDLPAEIRNMIYEQILLQEEDEEDSSRIPRRPPAISHTCRTVNKEILSLLFLKYGWLLCK